MHMPPNLLKSWFAQEKSNATIKAIADSGPQDPIYSSRLVRSET